MNKKKNTKALHLARTGKEQDESGTPYAKRYVHMYVRGHENRHKTQLEEALTVKSKDDVSNKIITVMDFNPLCNDQ